MLNMIYIVDDEPDILDLVTLNLTKSGFKVKGFHEAKSFFDAVKKAAPTLVILDLMLPDQDGIEICKELRQQPKTSMIPIIMLTAKADESDKIIGLELGADDYVTKPFSPKELVARVKAVLRRGADKIQGKIIKLGDSLTLDMDRYEVQVKGKVVDLTQTEFNILKILISSPGRVYSREQILDQIWGNEKIVVDRTVDVHIKHLREKLGKTGQLIKNIRGVGYKIDQE